MSRLAKLTWPEAAEALGSASVVILPIGATEAHGPHLPLDTDVTIAFAQADRVVVRLAEAGVRASVLPALPYGLTNFAEGFAGTVSIRPGTLWSLIEDIFVSLEEQGVERIVLCNAHLEPAHIKVLRGVIMDHLGAKTGGLHAIFPDNTRRRFAQTLGEEFASGECHAGRYESSIVMASDDESVRDAERIALPPKEIGLIEKMQTGVKSFREAGAELCYCGDPAAASAEEGRDLINRLADMTMVGIREAWPELFS
ncbi:MAG: creatinine amidohydrolase [Planctomycetota bacterium]